MSAASRSWAGRAGVETEAAWEPGMGPCMAGTGAAWFAEAGSWAWRESKLSAYCLTVLVQSAFFLATAAGGGQLGVQLEESVGIGGEVAAFGQ